MQKGVLLSLLDLSAGHPREDFFFFSHIYLLVAVKTTIPNISSPPFQATFGRPPPPRFSGGVDRTYPSLFNTLSCHVLTTLVPDLT